MVSCFIVHVIPNTGYKHFSRMIGVSVYQVCEVNKNNITFLDDITL